MQNLLIVVINQLRQSYVAIVMSKTWGKKVLQVEINGENTEMKNDLDNKKLRLIQILKHVEELRKYSIDFQEIDYFARMIEMSAKDNVLFYDYKYS